MADLERFWRKTPLGPLGVKPFLFIKWIYFYENHNYSCSYGLLKGLKGSDFNHFFKAP
jgi:hypothetical protein